MPYIPPYIPKIRLIARDGRIWEYKTLTKAADELYEIFRWGIREQIGDTWIKSRNWDFRLDTPAYFYYPYILRTEFGDVVTVDELWNARTTKISWRAGWMSARNDFEFRNGPVPYTGGRRRWVGCRHMKTTQEICEADALRFDDDAQYYGIKARAKRNRANLPEAWDDHWRPYDQKNWKNYRKNQWKKKR